MQKNIFRSICTAMVVVVCSHAADDSRPNILFCLADDWSWMNAGCYGDTQARTPNIDALAAKGIRFEHAFCSAPSCSPSRASILTGRMAIELEEAANLYGGFQNKFAVYPALLEQAGYFSGSTRKGWAPGDWEDFGWKHNPAGQSYPNFEKFLKKRPDGKPFCFWFGSIDPHMPYEDGYAESSGFMPDKMILPPFLMNTPGVRKDFAGYLAEIARFDREVDGMVKLLEKMGELDNTIVVVTSDNGMPFPGAKTRLYDRGTRMPLIVYWKKG
ncbi:MAG: sulfatase, partial [Kiritimatiellales bacterium]|nr:sulfatase [Kiritimatiellales bacterium]